MALVEISQVQGRATVTVFRLKDAIHLGNYLELETYAKDAYKDGARNIILDLGEVDTLTSIGIRAIVLTHKAISANGTGFFKIARASAPMRDVLEVTGITQFIEVFDTVDAAAASF